MTTYQNWRTVYASLATALNIPPTPGGWAGGGVVDQWGVYTTLSELQSWGLYWEAEGGGMPMPAGVVISPGWLARCGYTPTRAMYLQAACNEADIAMAAGPPFTGPPPTGLYTQRS